MSGFDAAACSRRGISARQGLHQVAQKFRTTGVPLSADRRVVEPSGLTQTKSGALAPTRPEVSGASTTAVITPTFVWPTNGLGWSCGATRAAREARAMIATNRDDPERERSEEHTSELQSRQYLVCRLLLEKKRARLKSVPIASA